MSISIFKEAAWKSLEPKLKRYIDIKDFKYRYSQQLPKQIKRLSKTSLLLLTTNNTYKLKDLYVPPVIKGHNFQERGVAEVVNELPINTAIIATAGAGKSTFLRHLFIESSTNSSSIQLFLEMQRLNDNDHSLCYHLLKSATGIDSFTDEKHFQEVLPSLPLTIYLDGLDEIVPDLLNNRLRELIDFCDRYPHVKVILTSRPLDHDTLKPYFDCFYLQGLSHGDCISLITRLPMDRLQIDNFLDHFSKSKYEEFREYANTPLLLIMLYSVFSTYGELTNNRFDLYTRIIDVLTIEHDQRKLLRRSTYTGLTSHNIKRILPTLFLAIYFTGKTRCSKDQLTDIIEKIKDKFDFSFEPHDLIRDLVTHFPLFLRDGNDYSIAHRTFIEYFSVLFIFNSTNREATRKVLTRFSTNDVRDGNPLQLCLQTKPNIVFRDFIIPEFEPLMKQINRLPTKFGLGHLRTINKYFRLVCRIEYSHNAEVAHFYVCHNNASFLGAFNAYSTKRDRQFIPESNQYELFMKLNTEIRLRKYVHNSPSLKRSHHLGIRNQDDDVHFMQNIEFDFLALMEENQEYLQISCERIWFLKPLVEICRVRLEVMNEELSDELDLLELIP